MADRRPRQDAMVFDRSWLPPARWELLVLSDTHHLLHPELQGGEWESIRQFPVRTERALRLAGALGVDLSVHLGDVTHEYPETGEAVRSRERAKAQLARHGLHPHVAPGNMDIGDKPDPTSPANWVSAETLAAWDAVFGRSWGSFDAHGVHGVVLNSPIMGGPLPEAAAQQQWLEADLAAHEGERIFLFLHHPPFFVDPEERGFGMYNSLEEPVRAWLLGLIRRYRVELVFAGHTHFVALNRIGETRFYTAPSTTTSRAGLPEAFTVLPPDQGRSDLPKLGFYLVRQVARGAEPAAGGPSVQVIRTGYDTPALDDSDPRRLVLTPPSRDLPASRVGVVATHPLGHMTPGPVIWPSVVRQRVRNDWSLMALLELGARYVRVPESDLQDTSERSRLPVLRGEGVAVAASWLWSPRADLPALAGAHRDVLDEVEVVYPGASRPDPVCLAQIRALRRQQVPVTLSTAIRETPVPPQYHGRTRIGYRPEELGDLDAWLGQHDCPVDRAVCRVAGGSSPWEVRQQIEALGELTHIGAVDLALDLPDQREETHAALAVEAVFAAAALPEARVWLAPLMDLDRSFDTAHGLLDRLSNPRPAFHAVRLVNTALFAGTPAHQYRPVLPGRSESTGAPGTSGISGAPGAGDIAGGRVLALAAPGRRLWLCLPDGAAAPRLEPQALQLTPGEELACLHLVEGTSERVDATAAAIEQAQTRAAGPALFVARAGSDSA